MPEPVESSPGTCAFLAGDTPVQTENGPCALDRLEPGRRVITYCRGVQTIRAVSVLPAARVRALRPLALAFPGQQALRLTTASRLLVSTPWIELLFGLTEAIVPAGSLLADPAVTLLPTEDRPYYALHLDRPDFIYAGAALWLASPAPVAGDGVVAFPHRLPRPELDHVETRLALHSAGALDRLLNIAPTRVSCQIEDVPPGRVEVRHPLRGRATEPTPVSEIPPPRIDA